MQFLILCKHQELYEHSVHFLKWPKEILNTDTFQGMKLISVILNFLKNIHIEKDIHLFFYSISKYLQKNQTWR